MPDIVGTWRLVETEARDPDGSPLPDRYAPYGPRPMGIVTFTADGRMMAVLCDGRAELPADWPGRAYNSYCGNYSFDGATLVTHVHAPPDPSRFPPHDQTLSLDGPPQGLRPPAPRDS